MLSKMAVQGARDACTDFGVSFDKIAAGAMPAMSGASSLIPRIKSFGQGQLDAAKGLFNNARGGLGGQLSPAFKGFDGMSPEAITPGHMELARASHRRMAMQSLKTLAPTLAVAGGLGLMHHMNKKKEEEQLAARQQAGMY